MTVYGSALVLPVAGGVVALSALLGQTRMVDPAGRATPDVATYGSASGESAVPTANTGLGGSSRTATGSDEGGTGLHGVGSGTAGPGGIGSGGVGSGAGFASGGVVGAPPPTSLGVGALPTAEGMPGGGTPVPAEPVLAVTYETETNRIPYRTRIVREPSMRRGARAVRTAGVSGERTLRYEVTTVDGERTGRRLVGSTVTREPVTRVIAVGTGRSDGRPDRGCDRGKRENVRYHGGNSDHGGRSDDRRGNRHRDGCVGDGGVGHGGVGHGGVGHRGGDRN